MRPLVTLATLALLAGCSGGADAGGRGRLPAGGAGAGGTGGLEEPHAGGQGGGGAGGEGGSVLPDDLDRDGYRSSVDDCDDGDPTVHPGAREIGGDGIDQDCDGFDAFAADVILGERDFGSHAVARENDLVLVVGGTTRDLPDGLAAAEQVFVTLRADGTTVDGPAPVLGDGPIEYGVPGVVRAIAPGEIGRLLVVAARNYLGHAQFALGAGGYRRSGGLSRTSRDPRDVEASAAWRHAAGWLVAWPEGPEIHWAIDRGSSGHGSGNGLVIGASPALASGRDGAIWLAWIDRAGQASVAEIEIRRLDAWSYSPYAGPARPLGAARSRPSLAVADRVVVAWLGDDGLPMARSFDPSRGETGPASRLAEVPTGAPVVVPTGSGFLALWTDLEGKALFTRPLDAAGLPLGPDAAEPVLRAAAPLELRSEHVAAWDDRVLVTWLEYGQVVGTFLPAPAP